MLQAPAADLQNGSSSQPVDPTPAQVGASAGGPTDEETVWEKPWNPSMLRANAKDWSLAGDTAVKEHQLLTFMIPLVHITKIETTCLYIWC